MPLDKALASQRLPGRKDAIVEADDLIFLTSEPISCEPDEPSPTRRQPPATPPKPSRLVIRAETISKRTLQIRDYVSTYIDGQTTTFSAKNTQTERPIVVSQATVDRVQAVGRGAAAASSASRKLLGFIAKKVEDMGDSAMKSQSLSAENKQRLGDASKAFQIVADSVEESVSHVTKKATGHFDVVARTKYGDQAADTSGHAVTAATKAVGVVMSVRGTPGLVIKSAGKGAVRAQLKKGSEVVLPEGTDSNTYLSRTAEKDLIVLHDDVVNVKADEGFGQWGVSSPLESRPGAAGHTQQADRIKDE